MDMVARMDEIAEDIFRICTHRPDGLAEGLVYNQFLIRAEQPLLMHTGMRTIFPDVAAAVGRLIKLEDLRWISGAHASRPDEFGAVNDFLAAAPNAQVVAGKVAVNVCLRHMVDRPARALADGEVLDLGGRTVRFATTAHVPFWEAGMLLDERERVLFCGDLFTVEGNPPPVSDADLIAPRWTSSAVCSTSPSPLTCRRSCGSWRHSSRGCWPACTAPPTTATRYARCGGWRPITTPSLLPREEELCQRNLA